jgi:hypothetical protein
LLELLRELLRDAKDAKVSVATQALAEQSKLREALSVLQLETRQLLAEVSSATDADHRKIIELLSKASTKYQQEEEKLRRELVKSRFVLEEKEKVVRSLHEKLDEVNTESETKASVMATLRLEKLQLLKRAEAFEKLLEERSQNLVDTSAELEQQTVMNHVQVSQLKQELCDKDVTLALWQGRLRSESEQQGILQKRLKQLEITQQRLAVFLTWQSDTLQKKSVEANKMRVELDDLSTVLRKKKEDEVNEDRKRFLLQQKIEQQKREMMALDESFQYERKEHETTRSSLEEKQFDLSSALKEVGNLRNLGEKKDFEVAETVLQLEKKKEELDISRLKFQEVQDRSAESAMKCADLTRLGDESSRRANELASKVERVSEELEAAQLQIAGLRSREANRYPQQDSEKLTELVKNEEGKSGLRAAVRLVERRIPHRAADVRAKASPKGLSAWIDDDVDAFPSSASDGGGLQSDILWLNFDSATR